MNSTAPCGGQHSDLHKTAQFISMQSLPLQCNVKVSQVVYYHYSTISSTGSWGCQPGDLPSLQQPTWQTQVHLCGRQTRWSTDSCPSQALLWHNHALLQHHKPMTCPIRLFLEANVADTSSESQQ